MMKAFKTVLAAAVFGALAGPAMAQVGCAAVTAVCDDDDSIVVEVTVAELIEVVVDPNANRYSDTTNDLTSPNGTDSRGDEALRMNAQFDVRSNTRYDLLIEPTTGTWVADAYGIPNFEQIRFVRAGNPDQWIGGELYVDPTPGASTSGANSGEVRASGADGEVRFNNQPAGVNDYTVGANFVASLFADTANDTGNLDRVAPPGRYFTNARITATVR